MKVSVKASAEANAKAAVADGGSIWFGGSSVGATLYPPGSTLGPRIQAHVQLVFVHFGRAEVAVDGARLLLEAGRVGLLLPGHEEHFRFARDQETLHSYVHIRPGALAPAVQRRLTELPRAVALSKGLENLIHQATTAHHTLVALSTKDEILAALALQMLLHYIGEAEAQGAVRDGSAYRRVPRAQLYIHDHLGEALELGQIARVVRLSRAQLTRAFKEALGVTPMAYVWGRRTAAAVELLKHSGLSIEEIAERCGFASRYHLSRRIKALTGLAPGALRRSTWTAQHLPLPYELD